MAATRFSVGLVAGLIALAAVPGAQTPVDPAQNERKLELRFDGEGYVTLVAQDVTVSEIFAEWARIGGSRIVNAERLPRARVSVQFDRTTEIALVESLIRLSKAQNAGWVVSPRLVAAAPTPSRLGLIHITPTSSPSASFAGSAVQASPSFAQAVPDDELLPVTPVAGTGPASAPQQQAAPQPNRGPGVFVAPPPVPTSTTPPGTTGRGGGGTPPPGGGTGRGGGR